MPVPPSQLSALARQHRQLSVPSARYAYSQGRQLQAGARTGLEEPPPLPDPHQTATPQAGGRLAPPQGSAAPPSAPLRPTPTSAPSHFRLPSAPSPQINWAAHQFAKGGTEEYAAPSVPLAGVEHQDWLEFIPSPVSSLRFSDL